MDSQRYLRCLGQPSLFAATGEPIRFRTRKHLALLVYLAVENRAHQRDRLAEFLWPKVSVTEARHSLATALSVLRPRVGLDALETTRDQVRLLPGSMRLDLDRLELGDVLGTEVIEPLEVAAFLEGFDIPDSPEFTHWKDGIQARLLPIIKDALLVLIDRCRRTGDTRQIERLADRMLLLDELSEEAIRAKMEARAFAGDRLTALEIFEEWKAKLAEELQAVPSDLVEGMAIRLRRRGWERTTLANIPNVPTDQWRGRPFIGRTAEYRMLYESWEAVRKGVPVHALILGDSGVGKTTLVQRLTTAAGLEGAAISRVQCYDLEREIPYSTLNGLIVGLLDRPGVSATSPEALAELSRTVAQVRQRFPNLPKPNDSQGETARIRLTEAFLEMLTVIAEEHPVILVVDDLHLADDVSLAVLHLIMRRTRGEPVMVVLVARPGELAQSSQAGRLRESAVALGIGEIEVAPLSDGESREMLGSLIHSDERQPGITEQRALLRAAAGYPMVLELLVQDWKASGEQSLALAVDAMTAELGIGETAKTSYRQILDRMTRSLPSTTHSVLNLAAVLGPRLNDLDMYRIVDLSAGQTMTGMAELVNRRVLRDGTQGLEFVNELVRGATYIGVPPTLRHLLHSNIADRLIIRATRGDEDLGLEIAWHCMRAARVDEATDYLLRGARESLVAGAVVSAERALSSAIPHLGHLERQEARLLLAEALQEQGRWVESLAVLPESETDEPTSIALILRLIAEHWTTSPSTEDLLLSLRKARHVIESNAEASVRVKAASAAALLVRDLRSAQHARDILSRIDQIPTTSLGHDDLTCLAESKARLLYNAYERQSCLEEIQQQLESRLGNKKYVNTTMGSLHAGVGAIACCRGRYESAKAAFQNAYDIALRLGNDGARGSRATQVSLCCFRLGDYPGAIEWSLRAVDTFGIQFAGYVECQAALYLGSSYALQNEYNKAYEAIARLESRISSTVPSWLAQAWLFAKADVLYLIGQRSEALLVGTAAIGSSNPTLHSSFFAGWFARWLALTSLGSTAEARARDRIEGMGRCLDTFDAIDQVEILCAAQLIRDRLRPRLDALPRMVREKLEELPPAVSHQLVQLGLLSS